MKVYVVSSYDGECHHMEALFSTPEKAEEFVKYHGTSYYVEDYDLDEPYSKEESFWEVVIDMSIHPVGSHFECEKSLSGERFNDTVMYRDGLYRKMEICVRADTYVKAIEMAKERFVRVMDKDGNLFAKVFEKFKNKYNLDYYKKVNFHTGEFVE